MSVKVFISYSRKDYIDNNNNPKEDSAVGRIVDTLKQNGIEVWIDINAHYAAEYFAEVLAKQIRKADKIVFISSANSNATDSEYIRKEIDYASSRKKPIVPILIDQSPFNDKFDFHLSGLDFIEFYKNEDKALEKLVLSLTERNESNEKNVVIPQKKTSVFSILKTAISFILVFFVVFGFFASIGFAVGYYDKKMDVETTMNEAFRENRFTAIDSHTLQYSGNSMSFTFDVETTKLKMIKEKTDLIEFSFESVTMATAIPIAFKNLFKSSRAAGNGKTRVGFLIVGSVAILCGYGIGKPLGESSAMSSNEDEIRDYFEKETTTEMMRQKLNLIYQ